MTPASRVWEGRRVRTGSIYSHYCGLPVRVEALVDEESGELQCPVCRKRYEGEVLYVAHVTGEHPRLVKGGNAP